MLPANLAHGKRDRRDALFDLRLDYVTEPAPDLPCHIPSSTCTAAVAEAAAAGEGSEAGVGEDGEQGGGERSRRMHSRVRGERCSADSCGPGVTRSLGVGD